VVVWITMIRDQILENMFQTDFFEKQFTIFLVKKQFTENHILARRFVCGVTGGKLNATWISC
jgi:hypothetical protein